MTEPTAQITDATADVSPRTPPETDRSPAAAPALVESDLLVEDISIDGMCGVY